MGQVACMPVAEGPLGCIVHVVATGAGGQIAVAADGCWAQVLEELARAQVASGEVHLVLLGPASGPCSACIHAGFHTRAWVLLGWELQAGCCPHSVLAPRCQLPFASVLVPKGWVLAGTQAAAHGLFLRGLAGGGGMGLEMLETPGH